MTIEETREILQQIRNKKCVSECNYGCRLYESKTFCLEEKALDIAIKLLEKQHCEEQYEADLRNAYDCGYNCGYADAMNDIAESEGE